MSDPCRAKNGAEAKSDRTSDCLFVASSTLMSRVFDALGDTSRNFDPSRFP